MTSYRLNVFYQHMHKDADVCRERRICQTMPKVLSRTDKSSHVRFMFLFLWHLTANEKKQKIELNLFYSPSSVINGNKSWMTPPGFICFVLKAKVHWSAVEEAAVEFVYCGVVELSEDYEENSRPDEC